MDLVCWALGGRLVSQKSRQPPNPKLRAVVNELARDYQLRVRGTLHPQNSLLIKYCKFTAALNVVRSILNIVRLENKWGMILKSQTHAGASKNKKGVNCQVLCLPHVPRPNPVSHYSSVGTASLSKVPILRKTGDARCVSVG